MTRFTTLRQFLPISDTLATAGQPTEAEFAAIAQSGYKVVINLALPTSDHALPDEQATVESFGMTYVSIPVVWENPTLADLDQFFQAMDAHQEHKIFVHCALNMRVSVFVYLYRILRLEIDPAMAQRELFAVWQPNDRWQRFIDEAMASHSNPSHP
ncbi:MAG: protein tyrosine phosphatase family protein [Spirulina sp.]